MMAEPLILSLSSSSSVCTRLKIISHVPSLNSLTKSSSNDSFQVRAVRDKAKQVPPPSSSSSSSSAEEITKKYGLEAGLWKVGISTNETGEKVGTFALAYAAHKAASPIRFPPTVALTPIVAGWIVKKVDQEI